MKKIVLTGFGPWGQNTYNSSWEILKDINLELFNDWKCEVRQLPVSWTRVPKLLEPVIEPDVKAVVCFGMCGGQEVRVERIATNLIVPTILDVDSLPNSSDYVFTGGPPAYWTGLPVKAICSALDENSIPNRESQWAGTYLCNFTFYWLMHFIAERRPDITGGFIHVPRFEPEGGMDRSQLCAAVPVITNAIISTYGRNSS